MVLSQGLANTHAAKISKPMFKINGEDDDFKTGFRTYGYRVAVTSKRVKPSCVKLGRF